MPCKRKTRPKHRADAAADKFFPNGISVTTLAIIQSWLPLLRGDHETPMSRPEFAQESSFIQTYNKILAKYPAISDQPKTRGTISAMLNDIGAGRRQLGYTQIRALAEFVELPLGLFILFTHCVSAEWDAHIKGHDTKQACLDIISGIRRVADEMEHQLSAGKSTHMTFWRQYGQGGDFLPSVEILKRWRDLYHNSP